MDEQIATVTEKPKKEKKPVNRKKLIIIIASVLASLGILAVIGYFTDWFGLIGPFDQIAVATKNTFTAKSFTVDIDVQNEYVDGYWDEYTQSWVNSGTTSQQLAVTFQVIIDEANRDVTIYGTQNNPSFGKQTMAIYKGYYITSDGQGGYSCYDCRDQINNFFTYKQRIQQLIEEVNKKNPNYKKAVNSAAGNNRFYDIIEEHVDFAEVKGSLKALRKQMNNRSWLKDQFDYTVKSEKGEKIHTFHIRNLDFARDLLPHLKPVFANRITYNDVMEALESVDPALDVVLRFGVKSKQLTVLDVEVCSEVDDYTVNNRLTFNFSNIGKTKIDTILLQQMLENAQKG